MPQFSAAGIATAFLGYSLLNLTHRHGEFNEYALALGGSLICTLLGLVILLLMEQRSKLPADLRIGVAYAVATAFTFLFLSLDPAGEAQMTAILKGDLLAANAGKLLVLALVAVVVAAILFLFRQRLLLVSFDPELAGFLKLRVSIWNGLLYLCVGSVVSVAVMSAGPLVVFGFLIIHP